jgi:hypothetical protein
MSVSLSYQLPSPAVYAASKDRRHPLPVDRGCDYSRQSDIWVVHTVDTNNSEHPYNVRMFTTLTAGQVCDTDPGTACTLACLGETFNYWKDQKDYREAEDPGWNRLDPTLGFNSRVRELVQQSDRTALLGVDESVIDASVGYTDQFGRPYREIAIPDEIDTMREKMSMNDDTRKALELNIEYHPDRPVPFDIIEVETEADSGG